MPAHLNYRTLARRQQRLMMCLATIAGFCDSYGLLHFKTYVSFMSGNTVQTGFSLGQDNLQAALIAFAAILFFSSGILLSTILGSCVWYRPRWMPFILAAFVLATCNSLTYYGIVDKYVGVALLSFAIGYLNNALSHVGSQAINPDFITGNLNNGIQHLAFALKNKPLNNAQGPWDTHIHRAILLIGVWASFLAGAFICSALAARLGGYTLLPPVAALLLCPLYLYKHPDILE